jgi:hypothetical protein
MAKKIKQEKEKALEKKLWKADKLRKNMNAAEYVHIVLQATVQSVSPRSAKRCDIVKSDEWKVRVRLV